MNGVEGAEARRRDADESEAYDVSGDPSLSNTGEGHGDRLGDLQVWTVAMKQGGGEHG